MDELPVDEDNSSRTVDEGEMEYVEKKEDKTEEKLTKEQESKLLKELAKIVAPCNWNVDRIVKETKTKGGGKKYRDVTAVCYQVFAAHGIRRMDQLKRYKAALAHCIGAVPTKKEEGRLRPRQEGLRTLECISLAPTTEYDYKILRASKFFNIRVHTLNTMLIEIEQILNKNPPPAVTVTTSEEMTGDVETSAEDTTESAPVVWTGPLDKVTPFTGDMMDETKSREERFRSFVHQIFYHVTCPHEREILEWVVKIMVNPKHYTDVPNVCQRAKVLEYFKLLMPSIHASDFWPEAVRLSDFVPPRVITIKRTKSILDPDYNPDEVEEEGEEHELMKVWNRMQKRKADEKKEKEERRAREEKEREEMVKARKEKKRRRRPIEKKPEPPTKDEDTPDMSSDERRSSSERNEESSDRSDSHAEKDATNEPGETDDFGANEEIDDSDSNGEYFDTTVVLNGRGEGGEGRDGSESFVTTRESASVESRETSFPLFRDVKEEVVVKEEEPDDYNEFMDSTIVASHPADEPAIPYPAEPDAPPDPFDRDSPMSPDPAEQGSLASPDPYDRDSPESPEPEAISPYCSDLDAEDGSIRDHLSEFGDDDELMEEDDERMKEEDEDVKEEEGEKIEEEEQKVKVEEAEEVQEPRRSARREQTKLASPTKPKKKMRREEDAVMTTPAADDDDEEEEEEIKLPRKSPRALAKITFPSMPQKKMRKEKDAVKTTPAADDDDEEEEEIQLPRKSPRALAKISSPSMPQKKNKEGEAVKAVVATEQKVPPLRLRRDRGTVVLVPSPVMSPLVMKKKADVVDEDDRKKMQLVMKKSMPLASFTYSTPSKQQKKGSKEGAIVKKEQSTALATKKRASDRPPPPLLCYEDEIEDNGLDVVFIDETRPRLSQVPPTRTMLKTKKGGEREEMPRLARVSMEGRPPLSSSPMASKKKADDVSNDDEEVMPVLTRSQRRLSQGDVSKPSTPIESKKIKQEAKTSEKRRTSKEIARFDFPKALKRAHN